MKFEMKTMAAVFLLIGAQYLEGCTYVPGVEPTNLSTVRNETATRAEVERVLGEPLESWATNEGSINVYLYDRGAEGGVEGLEPGPGSGCGSDPVGCLVVALLIQPFVWASTPILYAIKVDEQEGHLTVTYDKQDRIVAYRMSPHALSTKTSWNGKWLAEDGSWSLYLEAEGGAFTGQVLRRGGCRFFVAGTISRGLEFCPHPTCSEDWASGRLQDERGVSAASLNGTFPIMRLRQNGRTLASFKLGKESSEPDHLMTEWQPNPVECEVKTSQSLN